MSGSGPRRAAVLAWAVAAWAATMLAADAATVAPRIVARHVLAATDRIAVAADAGPRVTWLGGASDLWGEPARPGTAARLWVVTDRGPNGRVTVAGRRHRTLLEPAFVPAIHEIALECGPTPDEPGRIRVVASLPLVAAPGRPLSGRPPLAADAEAYRDASGGPTIAADPDGIDSEGLVRLPDGRFLVAEEYGPSLVECSAAGVARGRCLPRGRTPPEAAIPAHEILPAAYAARRDNRGFESLALGPHGRVWVGLQSPLDHHEPRAARQTGNLRLLGFDVERRVPVAEHVYRLGPPAASHDPRGTTARDGKLSALVAVDAVRLLALELDDGSAAVYEVDLARATDTLPRADSAAAVESIADLAAAGIVPAAKRLVVDLTPLLPEFARDVWPELPATAATPEIKLEGLAVVGPRRLAVVNDDDFGCLPDGTVAPGEPGVTRTCVWICELSEPLALRGACDPRDDGGTRR